MRILVTGSAGHLGEALVRTLQGTVHEVVGVDILPSAYTDIVGSITDPEVVARCMRGVSAVLHAATLHKPHIATHTMKDFIDTNITGTLNLLEAAAAARVKAFVFTSTTSVYGDALVPPAGAPAAWITESVAPVAKNIYGVTKIAAENLCQLFHRNQKLPCLILRTSRFFPEIDDDPVQAESYADENIKANEFLYRRVAIDDAVSAHLLALEHAAEIGFDRFIISATTPFSFEDLLTLRDDAPSVLQRKVPSYAHEYDKREWAMFPRVDRVYVNARARQRLGWQPKYDFEHILLLLRAGQEVLSPLARSIGIKGYHTKS